MTSTADVTQMNFTNNRWYLLTLGVIAIGLRLPLMGDQPYTDEGIYAAASYFDHLAYTGALGAEGWLIPKEGNLSLYALLTSWVFFFQLEPLFLLRLVDAFVATAAGWAVFRFLATAMNDRLIAAISSIAFIVIANHPVFINAGYKNSIMIAMTLMALALVELNKGGTKACVFAGIYMACAILFREFFLPMGIVVALYCIVRTGWAGLFRFTVAGSVLGVVVIATLAALRGSGGFSALIDAYFEYNGTYAARTSLATAVKQSSIAVTLLLPMFPLVAVGLASWALSRQYRDRKTLELFILGILLAICPALEIWYKPPYPYHFSQSIFGLAILFALGLRVILDHIRLHHSTRRLSVIVLGVCAVGANLLLFDAYARQYYWQISSALRFVPVMIAGDWSSKATELSVYLRAARAVRDESSRSSTMITEYRTVGLFPLTGRLPSAVGMGNLGRVMARRDPAKQRAEMAQLVEMPPDILVLMPHPLRADDINAFPLAIAALYPRRIDQARGLAPYGGWRAEIYFKK